MGRPPPFYVSVRVCVFEVLLGHSSAHWFAFRLWLLLHCQQQSRESVKEMTWLAKPKILPVCPFRFSTCLHLKSLL